MYQYNRSNPVRALALPRLATGFLAAMALFFAGCADPSSSPTNSSNTSSGPALAKVVSSKDKGGDKNKGGDKDKGGDKNKGKDNAHNDHNDHGDNNNDQCEGTGPGDCIPSGAASDFALLGATAVTATDAIITGDVGSPIAVTLTGGTLTGTVHLADLAATEAIDAFLSTYDAIALTPCGETLTTLDGLTLAPGVYCFDAAATSTGGVLTLDGPANGIWIFKIGTLAPGALTGTNFSVLMANGGSACNVTWWVDAGVTMTDSNFLGNILAGAAITLTRGTFNGNAWAKTAVTVTGPTEINGCEGSIGCGEGNGGGNGDDHHGKGGCNQGVGNGAEDCDPGNSNHNHSSNDEDGGTPGNPGRKGGKH